MSDQQNSFRDRISTVDREGKRAWVYPKKPKGRLTNYRRITAWILLVLLFIMPFMKVKGNPFILLNILDREFYIFGMAFWPQDFHLLVIATITMVVFIILFTVVYGRIWCGWACPQTIFMEMLFRPIEYAIEGDASAQRRLNAMSWNGEKIFKKSLKHGIFWVISFVLANIFLAYFMGGDALIELVRDPVSQHLKGFFIILTVTTVIYWIYASFREQICVLVCPYGRLQGVLLDQKSIVVAYDYMRGEPREKLGRSRKEEAGDCIECGQCVQVCPTGIDIRNGTQLECVNCTACIDACDHVMESVKKPRGLIRYASHEGIGREEKIGLNTRIMGYSAILLILVSVLVTLFVIRKPVETVILRTPGIMYQTLEDGRLQNLYNIKVINKTAEDMQIDLKLLSHQGTIVKVGGDLNVKGRELIEKAIFVKIPPKQLTSMNTKIKIGVFQRGELLETVKSSFIGPPR